LRFATCIARWARCWRRDRAALRRGGLPDETIHFRFTGSPDRALGRLFRGRHAGAGGGLQRLRGQGLSGGGLSFIPKTSSFLPEESILVATWCSWRHRGEAFFSGIAGDASRCANSGATAWWRRGRPWLRVHDQRRGVVLGATGRNFAAGMKRRTRVCLRRRGDFSRAAANRAGVDLEPLALSEDVELVRGLIQRTHRPDGQPAGGVDSGTLGDDAGAVIKVFPHEYKRVLGVPRAETVYVSPAARISPATMPPLVATGQVQHG